MKNFVQRYKGILRFWGEGVTATLSNKLDCFADARNDGLLPTPALPNQGGSSEAFLRPLMERGRERGKKFAQQTEKALVPQYLSALVPSKCAAFTLAEVLITLGVIGIVVALTLPTLISNHNKKVWAKGLAKAYSATSQACQMALAQDGVDSFWDTEKGQLMASYISHVSGHTIVNNTLASYYKNAKVLRIPANHYGVISAITSHSNGQTSSTFVTAYGNHLYDALDFPDYTLFPAFKYVSESHPHYHPYYNPAGSSMYYIVDANGFRKKPNIVGKDVFVFGLNGDCSLDTSNEYVWGKNSENHYHSTSGNYATHISHCYDTNGHHSLTHGISDMCFAQVMRDGWEIKYTN